MQVMSQGENFKIFDVKEKIINVNNISLPTQRKGWLTGEMDETVATETVELTKEEIIALINRNEEMVKDTVALYSKYKEKHLSDALTYLLSIDNSLSQLL